MLSSPFEDYLQGQISPGVSQAHCVVEGDLKVQIHFSSAGTQRCITTPSLCNSWDSRAAYEETNFTNRAICPSPSYTTNCHVNTMKYQTGIVFPIKDHPTKYCQALTYANSSFFMKYSTMKYYFT